MHRPSLPDDASISDESIEGARQRLVNLLVLRRMRRWFAQHEKDQRLEARAWRYAWVFFALCAVVALVYGLRHAYF